MYRTLLVLLCAVPALGWADYVRVDRSANVYASPDSDSAVLERIRPEDSPQPIYLVVANDQLQNGYHNVRLQQGTGWIYKSRVRKFAGDPPGTGRADVYGGFPDDTRVGDQVIRLENAGYVVGYSETKTNPLWVAYRLGPDQGHQCPRLSRFRTDDRTQAAITHDHYTNAGYDRGHMAPSSNIGTRFGCPAQNETYFMSNIAPQIPLLNQRPWGALENLEEAYPTTFGQVWVITGPIFDPVFLDRLCSGVEIPVAFYKIVVRQVNGSPDVLAVIFDQSTQPGVPLSSLVTTVDEIERRTGIDFLAGIPDTQENSIESTPATDAAWHLDTRLDTNFRPGPRERCTLARIRRDQIVDQ
jgi:endonuclease G